MFRTQGEARTGTADRRLAGYLALIAGMVNSGGFVLIGSFTSHVTGNVGRLADDVVLGHAPTAFVAAGSILTFFVGAFITSFVGESAVFRGSSHAVAALLGLEAILIGVFVLRVAGHAQRWEPMLLSCAMGIQNSLITRLSGAIVRTTHLTGVVTDLGIESARWLRHFTTDSVRPPVPKIALLGTIFVAFVVGSGTGALLTTHFGHLGLVPVLVLLLAGILQALRPTGR